MRGHPSSRLRGSRLTQTMTRAAKLWDTTERLPRGIADRDAIVRVFLLRCIRPQLACAVERRRFPVGANPTRQTLQPEATGAAMEVTKWLKPSDSVSRYTVTARVCRPQRE